MKLKHVESPVWGMGLTVLGGLLAIVLAVTAAAQENPATTSFDGLVKVDSAKAPMAYIDPDADFSVYRRIAIVEPYVAFRANWRRDQNLDYGKVVRDSDMERIKRDVASLFREVFIETLEADNGFEVVSAGGEDVLLVRPAIIELDITAPDLRSATRSANIITSAGSAVLYIELYDSLSGAILGRAADGQVSQRMGGSLNWSNRVTNAREARKMFGGWAQRLRDFLELHFVKPAVQAQEPPAE